jgi:hypothetical protein
MSAVVLIATAPLQAPPARRASPGAGVGRGEPGRERQRPAACAALELHQLAALHLLAQVDRPRVEVHAAELGSPRVVPHEPEQFPLEQPGGQLERVERGVWVPGDHLQEPPGLLALKDARLVLLQPHGRDQAGHVAVQVALSDRVLGPDVEDRLPAADRATPGA